jgi:dTDP-4-dehydrorhamnose 3,5-epimerase
MKVIETFLKGCYVFEPKVFKDDRGSFFETFNKQIFKEKTGIDIDFVQDNVSISKKGVIRGLHLQKEEFAQAKLVRVFKGKILDIAVDFRKESPTFGKYFSIELTAENNKQIFIPRGFAHGFSVLEDDTIVNYKCDNYYNKDAEDGVLFNDPTLGINWMLQDKSINLSKKDKTLRKL